MPSLKGAVVLPGAARAVAARPGTGTAYVATDDGLCLVDGKTRTLDLMSDADGAVVRLPLADVDVDVRVLEAGS